MPGLVLQMMPRNDDDPARLGFTVTKKIGNAVIRNRTRRRLKEAARLVLAGQPVRGVDLVLIGREGTAKRDFGALQDDLRRALARALKAGPTARPRAGSAVSPLLLMSPWVRCGSTNGRYAR